jgi:DNA-binding response OmpR family regulator
MAHILVVEDEVDLNNLLKKHLEEEGHSVTQAFDGVAALEMVAAQKPQLIILDWMLPHLDGLSVCRELRKNYLMPVIMLTARNEEIDRLLGLEVGADDYIAKPFSIREVLARVRALLRRVEMDSRAVQAAPAPTPASPPVASPLPAELAPLVLGNLEVRPAERIVLVDNLPVDLTPKEFELLELFVRNPGRAFGRDFLLNRLWNYEYVGLDRTVDAHVTRLRKKLGILGDKITTVWGVGYRFVP